jgi:hypothetical protein
MPTKMLKNVNDQKSGIIDNLDTNPINQEISNNNIEIKTINEQPVKNTKSKQVKKDEPKQVKNDEPKQVKNDEPQQVKNDVQESKEELVKKTVKTVKSNKTTSKEVVEQEGGQEKVKVKVNKIKNKTIKDNTNENKENNDNNDNKTTKKTKSNNDKPKKVKKDNNDDDALENEDELVNGKHIRSFKVKLPASDKYEGRFTGLTPYQAANKALSKFFRESDKPNAEITFSICESTRKSKKSTYTYVGRRLQLEIPVKYKIQDGREIIKNFKNSLKKVKKSELINININ